MKKQKKISKKTAVRGDWKLRKGIDARGCSCEVCERARAGAKTAPDPIGQEIGFTDGRIVKAWNIDIARGGGIAMQFRRMEGSAAIITAVNLTDEASLALVECILTCHILRK